MVIMSVIRSAILSQEQKEVLKDSILSYVTTLQKRFYKDSLITEEIYHEKMQQIQDIVNVLHLNELYKFWCDTF